MTYPIKVTVKQRQHEISAWRRHFHEYPELSKQEFKTMEYIENILEKEDIFYHYVEHGGIIAWIDGAEKGKTVLLRTDIDALPIQENQQNLSKTKICKSKIKGVMHACGHDGHMAMLLEAAKILNEWKQQWKGRVVLLFEEGEEVGGPLAFLIDYLQHKSGFQIDACYATHVRWDLPSGKIAVVDGYPMAGGFGFQIKLKGHGGHGSRPDLANSPIECLHAFYNQIEGLRMRLVPPTEALTFSLGSIHGGIAHNIIPDEVTFSGTCRFFDYEHAGKPFYEAFFQLLEDTCHEYHCEYKNERFSKPFYAVQNNKDCVNITREAVKKYIGDNVLYPSKPWIGSESFAVLSYLYPSVLSFTGIQNLEEGCGANHHSAEFDIDETGLLYGTMACLGFALEFLNDKHIIGFSPNPLPLENLWERINSQFN